jgi:hypothetical protein
MPDWSRGRSADSLGPERVESPWLDAPRAPRRSRLGSGAPLRASPSACRTRPPRRRPGGAGGPCVARRARGRTGGACRAGRACGRGGVRRFLAAGPRTSTSGPITVLAGPSSNGRWAGRGTAARSAGHEVAVLTAGAPRIPAQTHLLRDLGVRVVASRRIRSTTPPRPVRSSSTRCSASVRGLRCTVGPAMFAGWLRRHDVPSSRSTSRAGSAPTADCGVRA